MLQSTLQRGTLLTVIVLVVCVFGILAVVRTPVQMIPDLEVRTVTVRTNWPGATPQDVEKEILIEQEEYLRNIPNLQRLRAEATTGEARVELEFPFGIDLNEALIRVNNALSQVPSYPENVDEPRIFATSFSANSFMFFHVKPLPGNPQNVDMMLMQDFLDDNVRTLLERVPGVSEVSVSGGAPRQVQIVVDPARLAERRITLAEVRAAVRARNRDVSGGDIDSGKRRYLVRTVGRFEEVEDLKDLIIAQRNGAIIRLGDVADVRLHHFEVRGRTFSSGQPALSISLRREPGSNVIEIKRAVMPLMETINRDMLEPRGMSVSLSTDDVRYVEESVANVRQNLVLGALLATLVMFLFLRSVPATLIGVVGIPICTIAAFLGLLLAGRTINVISLAGVAFAIGMTLDNSIVVLESIERLRREGRGRIEAALLGVQRVWPAVLASTLTTVLVFAPVLFVREEAGQLYSDVAIAISASILASMLVAITVIPAASGRLPMGLGGAASRSGGAWLKRRMLALVSWLTASAERRYACIGLTVAFTVGTIVLLTPPAEYLPEGEEPKAFSSMYPPPGYSLPEMLKATEQIHERLLPAVGDDPQRFHRGETEVPSLAYMNLMVDSDRLRIIAETTDPSDIDAFMEAANRTFTSLPGMRAFSSRGSIISSNDGGTRSVTIDVGGADLATLYATAADIAQRSRAVLGDPQIRSDPSSLSLAQPLLVLRPRWERAAELGFTAEELGYSVAALTDGAYVDEFFFADDKVDIFLYGAPQVAAHVGDIPQLPVYAPQGTVVPVGAVAEMVETVDTGSIRRVDGRRMVTLYVIPPRSIALETAVAAVEQEVIGHLRDANRIPAGVSVNISGASDQLQATRQALSANFIVALVLCYLLLVAIFTHWGYPLIIMASVPLGIAGGIIGLWLLNAVGGLLPFIGIRAIQQPLDMITMMGFLILVGTVVNNPILIVHQAIANLREQAMEPREAVRSAVESRLRPVMMSTITTICGLAPLVFIPGAGVELYRGLGAIVLFGLFFATCVTLTFLPALLIAIFELKERWQAATTRLRPAPLRD